LSLLPSPGLPVPSSSSLTVISQRLRAFVFKPGS
jgi:hypothetical protein